MGTDVEGIFEDLKKFLSPGSIWQKILVPQHNLVKGFCTPSTKIKVTENFFVPIYNFKIVFVPRTLNKQKRNNKKQIKKQTIHIPKGLIGFLNYV